MKSGAALDVAACDAKDVEDMLAEAMAAPAVGDGAVGGGSASVEIERVRSAHSVDGAKRLDLIVANWGMSLRLRA